MSGANLDEFVIKKKETVSKFATFASSCSSFDQIKVTGQLPKTFKVSLSDSSKTRKEVLVRIFSPLLQDAFSLSVTNKILEHLGLTEDIDYLQTVSSLDISNCNLYSQLSEMEFLISSTGFNNCSVLVNGL